MEWWEGIYQEPAREGKTAAFWVLIIVYSSRGGGKVPPWDAVSGREVPLSEQEGGAGGLRDLWENCIFFQ